MEDKQIQCVDCKQTFAFTAGDQEFYQERGMNAPKRCKTCREVRKANNGGGGAKDGGGRVARAGREMDALFKPAKK